MYMRPGAHSTWAKDIIIIIRRDRADGLARLLFYIIIIAPRLVLWFIYYTVARTQFGRRRLGRNRRAAATTTTTRVTQTKLCASKPTRELAACVCVCACVCRNLVTASATECTNTGARAFVWTAEICSSPPPPAAASPPPANRFRFGSGRLSPVTAYIIYIIMLPKLYIRTSSLTHTYTCDL